LGRLTPDMLRCSAEVLCVCARRRRQTPSAGRANASLSAARVQWSPPSLRLRAAPPRASRRPRTQSHCASAARRDGNQWIRDASPLGG
jgi:hypothetical protein